MLKNTNVFISLSQRNLPSSRRYILAVRSSQWPHHKPQKIGSPVENLRSDIFSLLAKQFRSGVFNHFGPFRNKNFVSTLIFLKEPPSLVNSISGGNPSTSSRHHCVSRHLLGKHCMHFFMV